MKFLRKQRSHFPCSFEAVLGRDDREILQKFEVIIQGTHFASLNLYDLHLICGIYGLMESMNLLVPCNVGDISFSKKVDQP